MREIDDTIVQIEIIAGSGDGAPEPMTFLNDVDQGDGEWGIYATECPVCARAIVHVAYIEDVVLGNVVIDDDRWCEACRIRVTQSPN